MINSMPFNRSKFRLVLRSNWHTGLSSGARFLDLGRTVSERGVTVVVLEICLSEKALIEVELRNSIQWRKVRLLNAKETAIFYNFFN